MYMHMRITNVVLVQAYDIFFLFFLNCE
jgi:hypothetical protein